MNPKQVNEAFVNHTPVKYGVSKVYVIGINSIRNEAIIKEAIIKAEQFDGSTKQITKYKVHVVGPTSWGDESYFLLPTKEGDIKLNAGDWIATGIDGEHWVISNDVFKKIYEPVEEDE